MPKCIVTGVEIIDEPLKDESDSEAHIIASALGGKLSPKGILSRKGNSILDKKIDSPYIKALQFIMNLLEGKPDRGKAIGSVTMTDAKGMRYRVDGQKVEALDFEFNVQNVGGEPVGQIKAPTMKIAKELLGKVAKEYGWTKEQLDAQIAKSIVVKEHPGALYRQDLIGPLIEFPSAFTMAALFCAFKKLPLPPGFNDYIDNYDENADERSLPPNTFHFIHEKSWFQMQADVGHCLILYCDPNRKQTIFFSQLFNLLGVAVLMPYEGIEPRLETYGIDVLTGKETVVQVNIDHLDCLSWTETHTLGPDLVAINQVRREALGDFAMERVVRNAINEISDRHLEGLITKEKSEAMMKELSELFGNIAKPEKKEIVLKLLRAVLSRILPLD